MTLLILGLLLWSGAHLFKRLAPTQRAAMGDTGKMVAAIGIFAGVALMVLGYRIADGAFYWGRSPMLVGINNLLMLIAIYLFAASGMKTAIARKIRHPMLAGMRAWAVAHILVNGDMPSFVLFGGLFVWAMVEVVLINKSEPDWTPPAAVPVKKELMAIVGAVIVYGVMAGVHTWLGYPTFG